MQQLRVIEGKKKEEIPYMEIYRRLFLEELDKYHNTENKENLKRLSYYGVKLVNKTSKDKLNYEKTKELFELTETVKVVLSLLTPNELITIFPIKKQYDGAKYQFKDYFSTMEELQNIGMDNCILSQIDKLLWDYMNDDINHFTVRNISALSDLNKAETGKGLMEIFAEKNGIDMYKMCKDEVTGKEYLYDPKTGKSKAVKKKAPRYLKLVK